MQFVIIGRDATDEGAPERRNQTRAAHLKNIEDNFEHMVMGAATLDSNEKMNGSVMIVDFPSRTEFEEWLTNEPYVAAKVWGEVEIMQCNIGPAFLKK